MPLSGLRGRILAWQMLVAAVLIGCWQYYSISGGGNWFSSPMLVAGRLLTWARGDLIHHFTVTISEMAIGVVIGTPLGVIAGLILGRSKFWGQALRPIIVTLYSVPLVTLAPLLIVWFGLGMQPKVVLVATVSFFLLFFSTFSGAASIGEDWVMSLRLMGATPREEFFKLLVPASAAWIMSGLKMALPYALIAATVGEMMAARSGLGFLVSNAAGAIDMTGIYAALVLLMAVGVATGGFANWLESRLLHWRATAVEKARA